MKIIKSIEINNGFGAARFIDDVFNNYNIESVTINNNLNLIHDPKVVQAENHYLEEMQQYRHKYRASVKLINLQYKGDTEDYKAIVDILIDSYIDLKSKELYVFATMQLVDDVESYMINKSVSLDNNYGSHYQFFKNPVVNIGVSYDS